MFGVIADGSYGGLRDVMRKETRRINPAGFSVGKVTDVTVLSQKLRASRRTISGRQRSCRAGEKGDSGIGGIDRSHRRESEEDEQARVIGLAGPARMPQHR